MRARLAIVLALLPLVTGLAPLGATPAAAAPSRVVVAQAGGRSEDKGADAEATGPPWTYQMARLSVGLLLLLAVGIGATYYRLIAKRQRGEA
jgi:hypothetical protein